MVGEFNPGFGCNAVFMVAMSPRTLRSLCRSLLCWNPPRRLISDAPR